MKAPITGLVGVLQGLLRNLVGVLQAIEEKKECSEGGLIMTKEEIIESIEKMTVLELAELVKALEEKFGVSAAMPVAQMAAVGTRSCS